MYRVMVKLVVVVKGRSKVMPELSFGSVLIFGCPKGIQSDRQMCGRYRSAGIGCIADIHGVLKLGVRRAAAGHEETLASYGSCCTERPVHTRQPTVKNARGLGIRAMAGKGAAVETAIKGHNVSIGSMEVEAVMPVTQS